MCVQSASTSWVLKGKGGTGKRMTPDFGDGTKQLAEGEGGQGGGGDWAEGEQKPSQRDKPEAGARGNSVGAHWVGLSGGRGVLPGLSALPLRYSVLRRVDALIAGLQTPADACSNNVGDTLRRPRLGLVIKGLQIRRKKAH